MNIINYRLESLHINVHQCALIALYLYPIELFRCNKCQNEWYGEFASVCEVNYNNC